MLVFFKAFKSHFHTACKRYTEEKPGRVVTVEVLASLVGRAWSPSLTPVNIMSGFRKCGIYPLNPGQIDDRQIAPSKVFSESAEKLSTENSVFQFTEEEQRLYQVRYEEGYNVSDPKYEMVQRKCMHYLTILVSYRTLQSNLNT